MLQLYYSAISLVVGIQSNSVCGFKIANCVLKINNEIYSKPSNTNTLYSHRLTCIDTMDYTIYDNTIHLFDLRDSLERFHSGDVFQKPIFNYNTNEIDDFEIISDTENLIVYGPHVGMINDLCNYTLYVNVDSFLEDKYLNSESVICLFEPDFIVGVNSDHVSFLQKDGYINSELGDYPVELYSYKNYTGIRIDKFDKLLLPVFLRNHDITGLFGIIKILTSLKLKEIIF